MLSLYNASVNSSWPQGISIFFALDGKFPGGGDSWAELEFTDA